MPITTQATFTCDRDQVTAEVGPSLGTPGLPEGWSRFHFDTTAAATSAHAIGTFVLCPSCTAALIDLIGKDAPLARR